MEEGFQEGREGSSRVPTSQKGSRPVTGASAAAAAAVGGNNDDNKIVTPGTTNSRMYQWNAAATATTVTGDAVSPLKYVAAPKRLKVSVVCCVCVCVCVCVWVVCGLCLCVCVGCVCVCVHGIAWK